MEPATEGGRPPFSIDEEDAGSPYAPDGNMVLGRVGEGFLRGLLLLGL